MSEAFVIAAYEVADFGKYDLHPVEGSIVQPCSGGCGRSLLVAPASQAVSVGGDVFGRCCLAKLGAQGDAVGQAMREALGERSDGS